MSFNEVARYRQQNIGSVAYDGGLQIPQRILLRNSGYLEDLLLIHNISSTWATAGPTGDDAFGEWCGAIQRLTLRLNAIGDVYDVSGFMAAVIGALERNERYGLPVFLPNAANANQLTTINNPVALGNPVPSNFVGTPGTSIYNNIFAFRIPVALYLANKPYPYGLIQLALNAMEAVLEIRYNPVAVAPQASVASPVPGTAIYSSATPTNVGTITGTTQLTQSYFDPVAQDANQPPLGYLHRWRELFFPISADGDNDLRLPAGNIYLRAIVVYVQGAANALIPNGFLNAASPTLGVITRFQVRYGGNLAPFDWTSNAILARMAERYGGVNFPFGVYVLDLIEDTHTERDAIDSAETTDLRLTITTLSGAYAGGAYMRVAVEELVPLRQVPVTATVGTR